MQAAHAGLGNLAVLVGGEEGGQGRRAGPSASTKTTVMAIQGPKRDLRVSSNLRALIKVLLDLCFYLKSYNLVLRVGLSRCSTGVALRCTTVGCRGPCLLPCLLLLPPFRALSIYLCAELHCRFLQAGKPSLQETSEGSTSTKQTYGHSR